MPIADRCRTAAALNVGAHTAWFHTLAGRRQEQHWRRCGRFSASDSGMRVALLIAVSPTSIFSPVSTPAAEIFGLSMLVLAVTGVIFVCVGSLLVYAVIKFRRRRDDDGSEPAQVYGSDQIELAWTIIPILIVVVLFLASARVITTVQDAEHPAGTIEVIAVGHQFWWEYRYPKLGIVTANELHVPVSDRARPTPTVLTLLSADTDHSFWVPRLAGKTDLIPNRANRMWIDPQRDRAVPRPVRAVLRHAAREDAAPGLRRFASAISTPGSSGSGSRRRDRRRGRRREARVPDAPRASTATPSSGTIGTGRFGPDLTHLMSRDTHRRRHRCPTRPTTCARGSETPRRSSRARACRRCS